jgi:hypothetical protein
MSRPVSVSTRLDPVSTVSRSGAGFGPDFTRIAVTRPLEGTTNVGRFPNR